METQSLKNDVANRCNALISKANDLYGTSVTLNTIDYYSKGSAAGWAGRTTSGSFLRFSLELLINNYDEMIKNIIPHEVAHLIHFDLILAGNSTDRKPHGHTWKAICRALGGSSDRTHTMAVTKARKTRQFEYTVPSGNTVWLSTTIHRKLTLGTTARIIKSTGERIHAYHFTGQCRIT